jgi:hypothetical protein
MKRLGLASVVLFTAACRAEPAPERSELEQAAHELQQLHNDDEQLTEHFFRHSTALDERMAWFHEALGSCDRHELYRSYGPNRARFLYHCERGQLEALIGLDDHGRVNKLLTGARGVNPPARVREAAERWLESPAATAGKASGCRIDRVDLGSVSGALFVMVCPTGEKTLVIDLDRNGEIRRSFIEDVALDEWRVPESVG